MMRVVLLLFVVIHFFSARAQEERNLLAGKYSAALLKQRLSMQEIKDRYPAYSNRSAWQSLDARYRKALIQAAEPVLTYKWQTIPATAYLEFVRSGNRKIMEDVYNQNITALRKLIFAELVEGNGRFIPQLINGSWAICEITSWSISASIGLQKLGPGLPDSNEPIVELGAGITANAMAWTYYFFKEAFDAQSPLIAARIKQEIERRILKPYYQRNDFWWMALDGKKRIVNNWNIWLNFNVLTCILLIEEDTEQRVSGIYKTMQSADQFLNYYKEDGGCEEGPAYWSHAGGMLFNYLSLLRHATGGSIDIFHNPLVKNIGAYIYKAHIDDNYYLNYADAGARLSVDAGLVYQYGMAIGDERLTGFGAYLAQQQHWEQVVPVETVYGGVEHLFDASQVLAAPAAQPYLGETWLDGTGIAIARDQEGTAAGFYFSALAGHNDESHNHNDVGTCVLFYNGQPILLDVGNETYTRQTFGPERYSIWTMRSAYHNLPVINGVEQKEGRQYAAQNPSFVRSDAAVRFSLDIAAAYPPEAGVKKWERSYLLQRKKSFTIKDEYLLTANNGLSAVHFMTSAAVSEIRPGLLQLTINKNNVQLQYDPKQVELVIEKILIADKQLLQSWPSEISRLKFKIRNSRLKGSHQFIFKAVP